MSLRNGEALACASNELGSVDSVMERTDDAGLRALGWIEYWPKFAER